MKKLFFLGLALIAIALVASPVSANELLIGLNQIAGDSVVLAAAPVTFFRDEEVYNKVKNLLRGKLGIDPSSVVMAPSFLRSIVEITNNQSNYKFNLKSGESVVSKEIESRLDRNDIFIGARLGYGILPVVSSKWAKAKLQTYPNQTTFPAVTAVGTEFTPDDLEVFWNSTLSLKVGNTVFIPNFDTSQFRYAPETQKSGATNYDQSDGANDGYIDQVPQIILSGEANIDLQVQVPLFDGIKVDNTNANTTNYLAIITRGFLIKEANSATRNAFKDYLK